MSTPINTLSGFYQRSLSQLGGLRAQLEELQGQVATGRRFERSSQDPVAASRLRSLERADRLQAINTENADRVELDLGAASDEISGITNLLSRARELAIAAGNDTLDEGDYQAIATELEQLGEELLTRANGVSLAGESLFSGEVGGAAYIRDASGAVVYNGSTQTSSLTIADGVTLERGITGPEFLDFDDGSGPSDAFALIFGLAAALQGGVADPGAAARDAISGFDASLDSANRGQTILGARIAWVETLQQSQLDRSLARAEEQADVGGVELTEAIAQLQQTLTVLEATQASFGRLSSLSLFDAI